jgi:acyl-CoA thioester hydrolase
MNAEKFTYPLLILESHLDTFGHVNNATYFEILEEARWDIIAPRGYGIDRIRELQLGPVILTFNVAFLKELKLRQNIRVETQMISYERKIGEMKQDIYDESGALCFEATLKLGLMDMTARKLVPPTPEWLHAIGMNV